MKKIIDESPFEGWKEFSTCGGGSYRFEDLGDTWAIYEYDGGSAYIRRGVIDKVRSESNRSLLARGIAFCDRVNISRTE